MNADGSDLRPIAEAAAQFARNLEVSPDGQWLVYNDDPADGNPIIVVPANSPPLSTGTFIDIGCGHNCGADSGATWSPNGSRLLFTRSGPLDGVTPHGVPDPPGVLTMNRDGSSKLQLVLTTTATDARWSPDGTQVSYLDGGSVFVVAANGSSPPQPATHEFPVSRGLTATSPDGLKSAFAQCCDATPDHSLEVFVANADGTSPQQVTFVTDGCQDPTWLCTSSGPGSSGFFPAQVQWQPIPAPDTSPPTCLLSPPVSLGGLTSETATVDDYGSGLAAITVTRANGATVSVPFFDNATSDPVVVTATNTYGLAGDVVLKLKDIAGNSTKCELVLAPPLGTQTIGAGVDFNPAGLAEAFRATASTSSTVDSVSVYVDSSSQATSLVAGIYADNGSNDPGQLLAKGLLTSVVSGTWNRVSLPTVSLGAGTRYWIALLGPLGSGTVRFRDSCCGVGGGSPSETSSGTTLTTLPLSWVRGTRFRNDGPLSGWAG